MIKYIQDMDLNNISGGVGAGTGVINYEDGNLLRQYLNVVPANETSWGVESNTGDGLGNFTLNAFDPQAEDFFQKGILTGAGSNGLQHNT